MVLKSIIAHNLKTMKKWRLWPNMAYLCPLDLRPSHAHLEHKLIQIYLFERGETTPLIYNSISSRAYANNHAVHETSPSNLPINKLMYTYMNLWKYLACSITNLSVRIAQQNWYKPFQIWYACIILYQMRVHQRVSAMRLQKPIKRVQIAVTVCSCQNAQYILTHASYSVYQNERHIRLDAQCTNRRRVGGSRNSGKLHVLIGLYK